MNYISSLPTVITHKKIFYPELESLRGIAALMIVLFHISWSFYGYDINIIRNSYLMVDFFFILSGFVIYHNYQDRLRTLPELWHFSIIRFGRIYPIHLLFLLLFCGFEIMKLLSIKYIGISSDVEPFSINSAHAFISNIFLLQSFGIFSGTFNGPSWSISAELYTYFIFAIIILLMRNKWIATLSFLISLVGIYLFMNHSVSSGFTRCLTTFFVGVLAYKIHLALRNQTIEKQLGVKGSPIVFLLLILIFLSMPNKMEEFNPWAIPLFALLIISITAQKECASTKVLRQNPFIFMGKISYSIYMSHAAVIWVATQFMRVIMKCPTIHPDENSSITQIDPSLGLAFTIATIIATIILSHYTYKYIEYPWKNRFRLMASKKTTSLHPLLADKH